MRGGYQGDVGRERGRNQGRKKETVLGCSKQGADQGKIQAIGISYESEKAYKGGVEFSEERELERGRRAIGGKRD